MWTTLSRQEGLDFSRRQMAGTHFVDEFGNSSYMNRFLNYLRERQRLADFGFFSFEWYPFDEDVCSTAAKQLRSHPQLVRQALQHLAEDGVPRDIPWIITEYGWSSFANQAEVELTSGVAQRRNRRPIS